MVARKFDPGLTASAVQVIGEIMNERGVDFHGLLAMLESGEASPAGGEVHREATRGLVTALAVFQDAADGIVNGLESDDATVSGMIERDL